MKKQDGFTLIELMIVVAIIGILAAVAIPAYQDYLNRSKMSEALTTIGACKASVTEYAAVRSKLPTTIGEAGCSSVTTNYVTSVDVGAGGVITAVIGNIAKEAGNKLTLTPMNDKVGETPAVDGDTILAWKCAYNGNKKYVPANCRA